MSISRAKGLIFPAHSHNRFTTAELRHVSIYIKNTSNQMLKVEVLSVSDMKARGTESKQQASGKKRSNSCREILKAGYETWVPVPVAARSKAWVRGRSPAETVGSNPTGGMDVCGECCVLSGSLCNELITRPEESYRV